MTLQEAKEKRRWWNQNGYKFKGEEMPAEVVQALKLLGDPVPTTPAIKVIQPALDKGVPFECPSFAERDGFSHQSIPDETPIEVIPPPQAPITTMPTPQPTDEELMAAIVEEKKTASPERWRVIQKEYDKIYQRVWSRNRTKKKQATQAANTTEIPQEHTEIKQPVVPAKATIVQPVYGISPVVQWIKLQQEIAMELAKAEAKHPNWPTNLVKQAAIVSEESGELIRATLQYEDEGGSLADIRKEALHTIATCIRLLKNLPQNNSL